MEIEKEISNLTIEKSTIHYQEPMKKHTTFKIGGVAECLIEIKKEEELIKKYHKQLEIYKKALQAATGKKVEEVYIYSVYLQKEIKVNV